MQSGIAAHATRPESMALPVTGSVSPSPECPQMGARRSGRFMPPGFAKLPVSRYSRRCSQLFSVECGAISMPRSSSVDSERAVAHRAGAAARSSASSMPHLRAHSGDVGTHGDQLTQFNPIQSSDRPGTRSSVSPSSTMIASSAAKRPRIGAGAHAQVVIGHRCGLGHSRVHHDELARRRRCGSCSTRCATRGSRGSAKGSCR